MIGKEVNIKTEGIPKKITRRQAHEKNRVRFSIREELQDRGGGGKIRNK
jgi:hypothetical protein